MIDVPLLAISLPRIDGEPRRALSCINVRHEEKALFDVVHSWWCARSTRKLSQADAMSLLLELAFENPRADLPPGLASQRSA